MKAISRKIERFCQKHPRFGVPHLIRYVVMLTGVVFLFSMMDTSNALVPLLHFSADAIINDLQIWRLFTFPFAPSLSPSTALSPFSMLIFLFFTYNLGSYLEQTWGQAKFNLYFLINVLFFALIGILAYVLRVSFSISGLWFSDVFVSSYYLHLSMMLAFATLFPQLTVRLFFLIPISMKWLGLIVLGLLLFDTLRFTGLFPASLIPFTLIFPYLLFCGDILKRHLNLGNVQNTKNVIHFKKAVREAEVRQNMRSYSRKCTVCGKTDTEYPDLEFRYCSRCNGYYCYCMEHISKHTHVE